MGGEDPALVLILKSVLTPVQQTLRLKPGEYTIGRDPTCDIIIVDPYVSRVHAKIFYKNGRWYVEDIGSKNGTYINGEDIRGRGAIELSEGTEVVIGFSALAVKGLEPQY